jgi:uncharacterized protein YbbC (DUF1343 family)
MALQTGAETLLASGLDILRGKRIGLITNPTAVVGDRLLIDLLMEQSDTELSVLFGPEHGVRLSAEAGEHLVDGRDPATNLPVYSLYGKTKKPTPSMLSGIDILLFDVQDVGARFYTYISTLGYAMQAAAEADIHMVVLDRPNPLGGVHVEGPILQADQYSFVGLYPIPIVHGMTVGELAKAIQRTQWLPGLASLRMDIIPIQGWKRSQTWSDLQLRWIPPSPNLPTFSSAQIYPGSCLFEGTIVSEGRGTPLPFRFVGAPWANPQLLLHTLESHSLPGVAFRPAQFTPQPITGKVQHPKFKNTPIGGIEISVTDNQTFSPVACGLHLVQAFLKQAPDRSAFFLEQSFAQLAGTANVSQSLLQEAPIEEIMATWHPELDRFREQRQAWLLY